MKKLIIWYYDDALGHKVRHQTVGSDLQKEVELLKKVFPHIEVLDSWAV